MKKGKKSMDYKWMFGVLDPLTHKQVIYHKNLSLSEFDKQVSECRKKLF